MPQQKTYNFGLMGGLDLVTPPGVIKPGKVLSSKNYEPADEGGYRRMTGYERYDGLPSPSDATYWFLYFDQGTGTEPVVTNIVTGLTSTNTAEILAVVTTSGTWGVDAAGYLVVFNADGLFADNETLQVSAATIAIADGVPVDGGGGVAAAVRPESDDAQDEAYVRAAREARRADISAVPGAGPINGVWIYDGSVYAFRDNVGQTEGAMWVDSSSGWTAVDLGEYLTFTTGTVEPSEGDTIQGEISTSTAVIVGIGVTSGSWSGGDAAGRIYIKNRSGSFITENLQVSAVTVAAGAGAEVAVTLPPGGSYEFENYNFGGAASTLYMWGCNGVGRGFRWDGFDFSYVHVTGLTDSLDKPEYLKPHKKQLFFSFGASLQHSAVGLPMIWNAIFGAAEIATGDVITGLRDQPGAILGIFNRNRTYLLYGDDDANWNLVDYSFERGAIPDTVQDLGASFYCDDRGVHVLKQTDAYGDLKMDSISEHVDPFYQAQKKKIVDSIRIKEKNQYRIYYNDNTGLLLRWDANSQHKTGMRYEFLPFEYANLVTAITAEEDAEGFERIFFGSDDGFVYEEKGDSFDGALIEYAMRLVFCHCASPRQKKRFHKVTFQIDAPDIVPIQFYPEYSYGDIDQPTQGGEGEVPPEVQTGGGVWDANDNWGEFVWDAQFVGEMEAYIEGQGINVSVLLRGESNYERPHTLQSATYNFTMRGVKR